MKRLQFLGTICFAMLTMYGVLGAAEMDTSASERRIGWESSGKGGAVAAGGSEAVAAGISILKQGGNAADAAAATLLALSITDYGSYARNDKARNQTSLKKLDSRFRGNDPRQRNAGARQLMGQAQLYVLKKPC